MSAQVLDQPHATRLAPPLPRAGAIALSPINQRRLANFRANRRGYYSFWIFVVLFVLSLFAEFIANDKPILASYKGELPLLLQNTSIRSAHRRALGSDMDGCGRKMHAHRGQIWRCERGMPRR